MEEEGLQNAPSASKLTRRVTNSSVNLNESPKSSAKKLSATSGTQSKQSILKINARSFRLWVYIILCVVIFFFLFISHLSKKIICRGCGDSVLSPEDNWSDCHLQCLVLTERSKIKQFESNVQRLCANASFIDFFVLLDACDPQKKRHYEIVYSEVKRNFARITEKNITGFYDVSRFCLLLEEKGDREIFKYVVGRCLENSEAFPLYKALKKDDFRELLLNNSPIESLILIAVHSENMSDFERISKCLPDPKAVNFVYAANHQQNFFLASMICQKEYSNLISASTPSTAPPPADPSLFHGFSPRAQHFDNRELCLETGLLTGFDQYSAEFVAFLVDDENSLAAALRILVTDASFEEHLLVLFKKFSPKKILLLKAVQTVFAKVDNISSVFAKSIVKSTLFVPADFQNYDMLQKIKSADYKSTDSKRRTFDVFQNFTGITINNSSS